MAAGQQPAPVSSATRLIALPVCYTTKPGDLNLVANGQAADVYCAPGDFQVVRIAADCLAADLERVTGKRPTLKTNATVLGKQAVIVGTLGRNAIIDRLVAEGKIGAQEIFGQWESFIIQTVQNPLPGVESALVIAGSDRRGTAFGVFTLSEAMGVSPWNWWADVPPTRRTELAVGATRIVSGPPSVKYRGIFINDEDWGMHPWAAKTFEPEVGDIGPKTYAKVFELLLRLKANYLWPAMHECTRAFNSIPENKIVADDYAIVMGSSHAEPMLYNNASEWKLPKNQYNYETNAGAIKAVWEKRVQENGRYENTYTIGTRGIHDSPMQGGASIADKRRLLEQVFADQREMLARHVNPKVEQVPQIFVPYKEVLPIYRRGLKVPDDATLLWVDDNHGYIRQLSTAQERQRSGGSGVYYHVSYYGKPEDYLWLESTPPALVWEEMHKAFENGADRLWVLNVGDIKPAEIAMEFFLRMAWDIRPWQADAQPKFLTEWSACTFGDEHASEIAAVLEEYYRLNFPAKPEHMHLATFTDNYGEIELRLKRFSALVRQAEAIEQTLPKEMRDSFFELVLYPVRGAALANRMHLSKEPADASRAYDQLQAETDYYNKAVVGGKWRHMMFANPRNRPALRKAAITNSPVRVALESAPVSAPRGYISFEAELPTREIAGDRAAWKIISGLGRSGDSIALLPTTVSPASDAALEYNFNLTNSSTLRAIIYSLPTLAINSGVKARYSVNLDGNEAEVIDIATSEFSQEWSANVLRGAAIQTSKPVHATPGKHTLRLHPIDPGLVFDKVVIDLGGLLPTHLGPPTTPVDP
jgi:hypothetical protein